MAAINVSNAISDAMVRTADVLFRPFRWRKWAWIGLTATLTLAGQGGFRGNYFGNYSSSPGGPSLFPSMDEAKTYFLAHLAVVVIVAVAVVLLLCAWYLVGRWLSSRAQFMLMDHVVKNHDHVKEAWDNRRVLGNSLFRFWILLDLVLFNVFLVIVAITGAMAWPDIRDGIIAGDYHFGGWSAMALVFVIVASILFLLVALLVTSVVFHLGVPVMYVREMLAWPAMKVAWREVFRPHLGQCILFILFLWVVRFAQGMWMGLATMVLMLCTCCTVLVVFIVPFVGVYPAVVLTLPAMVYERAYKLFFISQFGDDYRVEWQMAPVTAFPVVLNEPVVETGPLPPTEPPVQ